VRLEPSGAIRPTVDGEVTSYFEWIGAGGYCVDARSGSMHGKKFLVQEVLFGSDGKSLFVRLDFHPGHEQDLPGLEARFQVQPRNGAGGESFTVRFGSTGNGAVECALGRIFEARIPLASAGVPDGAGVRFQFSLWEGGLPMDAIPQQGWLELTTTDPDEVGR
jgi:hypothetical protein